ncbi:hypothetical protein LAZ40_09365 [Cereibacter sphaeroides]|uniref:hypothetical protein n=1 Tax=Cereibacter sphaeroides TaxID=1063 RepID=UPI001F2BBEB0|nr:hypothetical protein [Cereibacter sphaeroides]MCE6959260.1 hypothetical protein [Cereibacter sphaeroides]MCE6971254.1 hypothetical protein [Cereibacter sphaeroides]
MNSFVLMSSRAREGDFDLVLRTHDLSGTDYSRFLRLSEAQARAIAGPHTGIFFLYDQKFAGDEVESQPLKIERVPDREPGTRAWQVRIGDELVMGTREDGAVVPRRLEDYYVAELERHATVSFEPGQPDWHLRHVESVEDEVKSLKDRVVEAIEKARKARADWVASRAAEPAEAPNP